MGFLGHRYSDGDKLATRTCRFRTGLKIGDVFFCVINSFAKAVSDSKFQPRVKRLGLLVQDMMVKKLQMAYPSH